MQDVLIELAKLIASGLRDDGANAKDVLKSLFGGRYYERHYSRTALRDATRLGVADDGEQGVPFAGLIGSENPESGPYGGISVVWFPTKDNGSLLSLVVGTRGLSSDEGILTRPGHKRRVAALRRMLAATGVKVWSKPDPANLAVNVPKETVGQFPGFKKAFDRYGHEMYCVALVPGPGRLDLARSVVQAFFDLYSYERGWEVRSDFADERARFLSDLQKDLFPPVSASLVNDLLRARHFVIIQGPPGTGKTRLAGAVRQDHFGGAGMTVQFHPAVTYEDFVVGLSPDVGREELLRFEVALGWLLQACHEAKRGPFLLVIDEVNRADLGKILGEAIYLFEPDQVGKRRVRLAHALDGQSEFSLPDSLYVLGTMNTADRSIANVDLAIRRRFSFVTMMPDREVVAAQGLTLATSFYDRICNVFVEHAPDESLNLLPGHSYFLANDEATLKRRFQYELLPLLDEYLRQGYLGSATTELYAVRDALADAVR